MSSVAIALSTSVQPVRLERRCGCPQGRRLPIRVLMPGLIAIHQALNSSGVDPETPLLTYKCHGCRAVVLLTLRDLLLVG